jgi:transcriptional regulator of arginine metabolism
MILWHERLRELLLEGRFGTQTSLVAALHEQGFDVTQPSVSRELSSLGARKVGGRYGLSVAAEVPGVRVHQGFSSTGPLVVLHTSPAGAPLLAQMIDNAHVRGVLGTIAGDDTVFVACAGPEALDLLGALVGRSLTSLEEH